MGESGVSYRREQKFTRQKKAIRQLETVLVLLLRVEEVEGERVSKVFKILGK